jgi:hypothetical protein
LIKRNSQGLKIIIGCIFILVLSLVIWNVLFRNTIKVTDADENKQTIIRHTNQPSSPIVTLKHKILYEGDKKSYMELYNYLIMDQWKPDEFLYWALIWANKYDESEGYYDVYSCLVQSCYSDTTQRVDYYYPTCDIEKDGIRYFSSNHLDKKTLDFALKYLKIAAERGSINAKKELERHKNESRDNGHTVLP